MLENDLDPLRDLEEIHPGMTQEELIQIVELDEQAVMYGEKTTKSFFRLPERREVGWTKAAVKRKK